MDKQFLDSYGGQTTAELIALKDEYRIDSLVLAFEEAIDQKPETDLSELERFVLAIEAMEREVNNGGWDQFFLNTDNKFNTVLVEALAKIGCPRTANIAQAAIDAQSRGSEMDYEELDKQYFASAEPIADQVFEYIQIHANEVELIGPK